MYIEKEKYLGLKDVNGKLIEVKIPEVLVMSLIL